MHHKLQASPRVHAPSSGPARHLLPHQGGRCPREQREARFALALVWKAMLRRVGRLGLRDLPGRVRGEASDDVVGGGNAGDGAGHGEQRERRNGGHGTRGSSGSIGCQPTSDEQRWRVAYLHQLSRRHATDARQHGGRSCRRPCIDRKRKLHLRQSAAAVSAGAGYRWRDHRFQRRDLCQAAQAYATCVAHGLLRSATGHRLHAGAHHHP